MTKLGSHSTCLSFSLTMSISIPFGFIHIIIFVWLDTFLDSDLKKNYYLDKTVNHYTANIEHITQEL